MHPSGGFAAITGLRCPHHAAHAEACLHSATAAPAPSRFLRRRRRSTPQPLAGEPFKRQTPKSLPCKGRWMRRKAQTEGCIAALTHRYPSNPGRALPRVRRGRCLHRPANPAMPQGPERYWQDKAQHPSVGWRRQLPLQGSLLGENRLQSLPCKGRWMRRKAQTEGCIAALPRRYPAKPGSALPSVRRGRCLHRPGNPALPQTPCGGRKRPPYKAPASG